MQYKLLGGTGLRVSEIALGSLNFGEEKDWGAAPEEARTILDCYAEAGGVFIDTAPNYARGAAEKIVGDFIKNDRDNFVISTKYTADTRKDILAGGNSRRTMIRSVEESLARLDTDYIDLLWLHYWDGTTPLKEILKGFDELISADKVRYVGFSDTPAWLVARAHALAEAHGWHEPAAIQIEYNVASRDAECEFLPMAEALDLGVVAWGPMAAGALARGTDPKRRAKEATPPHLVEAGEKLSCLADAHDLSVPALALRWLLRRKNALAPIPIVGARTKDQLRNSLAAADGDLTDQLARAVDEIAPPVVGFPHNLITSAYLRRLAYGQPDVLAPPHRSRR